MPDSSPRRPPPEDALMQRLRRGEIELLGRMPWSSNATFLVQIGPDSDVEDSDVEDSDVEMKAVYKPHRGERPLWDFPSGLFKREAAAFELAAALDWWVVPPTIVRDGPLGVGSVQLFVEADFEQHYFTVQDEPSYRWDFQALCCLDIVANNTDRKSGHCLLTPDGRIWGIDNGLSFHEEFKLRTVIWEFGGEPIPEDLLEDLRQLVERGFPPALAELLSAEEIEAAQGRLGSLVSSGHFPIDRTGRRYPWPLV